MNEQAQDAITGMLNCFPQTNQNYEILLLTLGKLLAGLSDQAIVEAAERYASGDVNGQSKKFAPAVPEFVEEVRRMDEIIALRARPRIEAPKYCPGLLAPFEIAKQKALAEHAHLPVLFEDIGYDQFRKMSAAKEINVGAKWVASLGTVYGPATKSKSKAP